MIDTHSHINFDEYLENFDLFLNNLKLNDIEKVIIPGVEPSCFAQITELCSKYEMLYSAIGVHPSEWRNYDEDLILKYLSHKKTVALGEIGLDFYYGADEKEEQKEILYKQLEIAQKCNLPVIIHDRNAHEEIFEIVSQFKLKDVVFHCFSGDVKFMEKCSEKNYYIALNGIVTFKNAKEAKEVAKIVPINRLLLETDAPYLTPVPFRGKINSPAYLKYIAEEIAQLRGVSPETIKIQTTENAKRIFNF